MFFYGEKVKSFVGLLKIAAVAKKSKDAILINCVRIDVKGENRWYYYILQHTFDTMFVTFFVSETKPKECVVWDIENNKVSRKSKIPSKTKEGEVCYIIVEVLRPAMPFLKCMDAYFKEDDEEKEVKKDETRNFD